MVSNQNLQKL
ncbi:hypothetical protein VTH06DRAFT_7058 [Thermothelomyces fergusii]